MADALRTLTNALAQATRDAAGAETTPLSINFDFMAPDADLQETSVSAQVVRVGRTLVFSTADLLAKDGQRILSATAVHKIGRG